MEQPDRLAGTMQSQQRQAKLAAQESVERRVRRRAEALVNEVADARALLQGLPQPQLEQQGQAEEHLEGLPPNQSVADSAAAQAGDAGMALEKVLVCEGARIMSFLPPSIMVRSVCRAFRDMAKPGVPTTQVADLERRLELVWWALDNGLELGWALVHLGEHGNLHALQLLRSRTPSLPWRQPLPWPNHYREVGPALCSRASGGGHLKVLQWAHTEGCPWDGWTCCSAAKGGHLQVLQWARANGCSWHADTCYEAAGGGHLDVLKWARAKRCRRDRWTCAGAAGGGHLEVLQWAHANACPWEEWTCAGAAGGGHLEVLQWARANGCSWDKWTCSNAAKGGHLEVLQWARANGCPWHVETCQSAAGGGHLQVLQWARVTGCPWDKVTCTAAANSGHLEVLQWARANGCAWDEGTCMAAAESGHLEVLQWARANGCPWHAQLCRRHCDVHIKWWVDSEVQRGQLSISTTPPRAAPTGTIAAG